MFWAGTQGQATPSGEEQNLSSGQGDTFGDRLRFTRRSLNWGRPQLARAAGVSESAVAKWERGEVKEPRLDQLQRLATALETTPAYLLFGATENGGAPDFNVLRLQTRLAELEAVVSTLVETDVALRDRAQEIDRLLANLDARLRAIEARQGSQRRRRQAP